MVDRYYLEKTRPEEEARKQETHTGQRKNKEEQTPALFSEKRNSVQALVINTGMKSNYDQAR